MNLKLRKMTFTVVSMVIIRLHEVYNLFFPVSSNGDHDHGGDQSEDDSISSGEGGN